MTIHSEHASAQQAQTIQAGTATLDITPDRPLAMSGYINRTELSSGVHDRLSVRALVVDHTALVTVDVVGLHEDLCARVRATVRPWVDDAIIHATHTHSGPASMPGRLGTGADEAWLAHVETSCVDAVRKAANSREPAIVTAGYGEDPDVARNRRHPGGLVDRALPVIRLDRPDGTALALLISYACHPVVLSAQNTLLSADYPGATRRHLEESTGATALFATSCAGDVNTGHALDGRPEALHRRTFARCEAIGRRIAEAALQSPRSIAPQVVDADRDTLQISLEQPVTGEFAPVATRHVDIPPSGWKAHVTALRWGPAIIVALPGEPFAQASLQVREQLLTLTDAQVVAVLGYSDGCPGYFPACGEYALGGYEVDDAHHYYGMPGAFARGSLERLTDTAVGLARSLCTASSQQGKAPRSTFQPGITGQP